MSRTSSRRKATWIAFCLVALAAFPVSAEDVNDATPAIRENANPTGQTHFTSDKSMTAEEKLNIETNRIYEEAQKRLKSLQSISAADVSYQDPYKNSFLSLLFPNERGFAATVTRSLYRISKRITGGASSLRTHKLGKQEAAKVEELLQKAVDLGHQDAHFTLAEISLFPPPLMTLNISRAFHHYKRHADITGDARSQSMAGFFYASGYGDAVEPDQAQATLYYTFAALQGDRRAEMAMGYRHWAGIGVHEDCMRALDWYESAAEASMAHFITGPPGGRTLPPTNTRLADLDGGVYGPGASVVSTGPNAARSVIKASNSRAAGETWEDVLEYYKYHADRGEIDFAYRLGKIYYHGSVYAAPGGAASGAEGVGAIPRDFRAARIYFLEVTRLVWTSHNTNNPTSGKRKKEEFDDRTAATAAMAAGYLGRMYLRGEGQKQNFKIAKMWFERGAEYGDRESQHGLGLIYRDGLLGKRDSTKASAYFMAAAGQDLADAQVQLGKSLEELGEINDAITYLNTAIRHGAPFEAYYYMASMHAKQARNLRTMESVRGGSCSLAVNFYKTVAERGSWKDDIVGEAERLWDWNSLNDPKHQRKNTDLRNAEIEEAKIRWAIAAESGYEVAQNNLAYLLDQDKSALDRHKTLEKFLGRFSWILERFSLQSQISPQKARLALTYYIRSASQRNIDALVKVADYYFHGIGTEKEEGDPAEIEKMRDRRFEKAAGYYHSAVETQSSALAMWNLGWMYENGVGVDQDFHLAKRYYDLALETNSEAYLPVLLALVKLHARSLWYSLGGGKQKGLTLWNRGDGKEQIESGDHWYLGKATAEFKKRLKFGGSKSRGDVERRDGDIDMDAQPYTDDDDSVEWARNRKREELERAQAEHDADGGFGPEDYFEAAISRPGRRGNPEDRREEAMDDLIFMLICGGIIGVLIYYRTRWMAVEVGEGERLADVPAGDGEEERRDEVPP